MRRSALVLLPAITIAAILIVHLSRSSRPAPDNSALIPATTGSPDPFDSIRTDLSDYRWPTDASRAITSSFAEYRRTHFHAGIDISTNDRTGYPVMASRAGYVSRISVEPDGYGKMLFVRHPDGFTTTYAHLERFADTIEARVEYEQRSRKQYPLDLSCGPDEFPVRKGEILAYSGETGTGSPHLHFEIRDENQNPVNPLLCPDFDVEDNLRPRIRRLALLPLERTSLVNGASEPGFYDPQRSTRSREPHFIVQGPVGFAVRARDKSDGSRYSHGIHEHRVLLDGRPIFDIELDRILFREPQLINLYYDQELLHAGKGRYERLFVDASYGIPFLANEEAGAGIIMSDSLAEGRHTFSVISTDFAGNEARIDGLLEVIHTPQFTLRALGDTLVIQAIGSGPLPEPIIQGRRYYSSAWKNVSSLAKADSILHQYLLPLDRCGADFLQIRLRSRGGGESPPTSWVIHRQNPGAGWLHISARVDDGSLVTLVSTGAIPDSRPRLLLRQGTAVRAIPLVPLDVDRFRGSLSASDVVAGDAELIAQADFGPSAAADSLHMSLSPLRPGNTGRYTADNGRFTLEYDSLSVYAPLFLTVNTRLEDHGLIYHLEPESAILRSGCLITVRPGRGSTRRGLFASRNGDWVLLRNLDADSAGPFTARLTRSLADLAILPDSIPPWAGSIRIRFSRPRRPVISFRYGDALAGVDYHELKTYIDGTFVIPEIDGEHKRVFIRVPEPLSRGSHRLTIRLADNLGNAGTTEKSFTVR